MTLMARRCIVVQNSGSTAPNERFALRLPPKKPGKLSLRAADALANGFSMPMVIKYNPGGVVILGSHYGYEITTFVTIIATSTAVQSLTSVYRPWQYLCACGTWKISSM